MNPHCPGCQELQLKLNAVTDDLDHFVDEHCHAELGESYVTSLDRLVKAKEDAEQTLEQVAANRAELIHSFVHSIDELSAAKAEISVLREWTMRSNHLPLCPGGGLDNEHLCTCGRFQALSGMRREQRQEKK